MRIAVLDSANSQADLICHVLSAARHVCRSLPTGTTLLRHLQHESCDLLVMGWHATDMSALDVLRSIREDSSHPLPVLALIPQSDQDGMLTAIEAGANDYLIKPIRRSELLARVQVLLKRTYPEQDAAEQLRFGPYLFESSHVKHTGRIIDLTQKEFDLALLFFRHLGRPLSRAFIQEAIWSRDTDIPSRTIDTHVSRVRSKLGLRPENGFRLVPVYSYGYKLEQLPE